MTRRSFLLAVALSLASWASASRAQQPDRVPVVGLLMVNAARHETVIEALRNGLTKLGYKEGKNFTIEYRVAQGQVDRLPRLADELVQRKVDVIVVGADASGHAAKQATSTIPIVLVAHDHDPVASGLIQSLSRPGGNVTGVVALQSELVGKRLELLKEAIPGVSRIAVFWDVFGQRQLEALEPAERSLGLRLHLVELRTPYNYQRAFRAARAKGEGAALILFSPVFYSDRSRIAATALENRLPVISQDHDLTRAGGFMSYGPALADTWERAAYFVDRLLKGAKPSELPVEQVSNFKFVVNQKTATALGVTVPQSIMLRADEVIR
jgi:putative ABC transport system substrate-binding protein